MSTDTHSPPARVRRGRACVASLTLATLAALTISSSASAGTYTVQSCKTSGGTVTSTTGWSAGGAGGPVAGQDATNTCASGGNLNLTTNTSQNQPGNSYRWWQFSAPADTTILGARIRYSFQLSGVVAGDTGGSSQSAWLWHDGWGWGPGSTTDRYCISTINCTSEDSTHVFAGSANSIGMTAGCGANTAGAVCGPGNRQNNTIRWASIDLDDPSGPIVGATSGSALDARSLLGTETVTVAATDQGSGLYRIDAKLGSTTVVQPTVFDANSGRCATVEGSAFGYPVPCKLSGSATVALNTALVPDGSYPLEVGVTDASGNRTVAISKRVTIDNIPAPINRVLPAVTAASGYVAGSQIASDAGTWTGASITYAYQWQRSADGNTWVDIPGETTATYRLDDPDIGNYVRVRVTGTNSEGVTTVASATAATKVRQRESSLTTVPGPTQRNGAGGDVTSARINTSSRSVATKYGRVMSLAGKLVDAAGTPISGAKVDVFEQIGLPGSARVKVATIMTQADGSYSYRPATFSNRTIVFAYSATIGSTSYTDSQAIALQVKSQVKFKASRHSTSRGSVVRFSGKVLASPLPRRGVRVVIEAQAGSRWVTAAVIRTRTSGKFRWRHTFKTSGRYRLRARVLGSSDLPASPSASRFVGLRVG